MKKEKIIVAILLLISAMSLAQTIENIHYISSFNDGLAAIKIDNQWAFMNAKGDMVIDFRSDLVTTNHVDGEYPVFKNNRCLISKEKDGISYFGYIDNTGKTILEPQYLNASNFINNEAIVLVLIKEVLGGNDILGKNIVNYKYYEVVIDNNGYVIQYLTPKGIHVNLDRKYLRKPPMITSKRVSDKLYAVLSENKTWTIQKIEGENNFQ